MKFSNRVLDWLIIGYLVAVFIFSTMVFNVRLNKIKFLSVRSDYILHMLLFIPWMILARWRWRANNNNRGPFWLIFGAGILLIVISELLQQVVPYRSISFKDLMANTAGLVIGALISLYLNGKAVTKRKNA